MLKPVLCCRNAIAAELERLQKEEEKRERRAAGIIDEEVLSKYILE